ncbi:hypothetical protein TB1_015985 [Malus domestica]
MRICRGTFLLHGFKRFSYTEPKKATRGFSEEIGRGAGGIVYKGVLPDQRVAAIKHLNEADQGEAEFLVRFLRVMGHGSLAGKLSSNVLDWEKRFEIAVRTAIGLACRHEVCLEWVLHCDVKLQNTPLDSNYQPKVADFGLSKLINRDGLKKSSFSRIRGTRGYVAPDWVYNQPITSKVDVYSNESGAIGSRMGEIIDRSFGGNYDVRKI